MKIAIWTNVYGFDRDLHLMGIEKCPVPQKLEKGIPLAEILGGSAVFQSDPEYKKGVRLVDSISSVNEILIVSKKLADFLRSKDLRNVEFIPARIRSLKGKLLPDEYCFVNPVDPVDVIDVEASEIKYHVIYKTSISEIKRWAFKANPLPKGVRLFRAKGYPRPMLIDAELAAEVAAQNFTGFTFVATP